MELQPLLPSLLLTGSVAVLVAMPAYADIVQVTNVQLNPTTNGLEVILETASGASPQIFTTSNDQTLVIDLSNTQLNLADSRGFRSFNPVQGITSVTVIPLSNNSIRVTVTGTQALPNAEVIPSAEGLVLGVTTQTPETSVSEDEMPTPVEEEIEIVVTAEAEEEDYFVPDASTATRTDTPLLEIPQSIQVVPEEVLEDQQVIRLEEALRNVSSVVQENTGGDRTERFRIRGFRTTEILQDGFRQFGEAGFAETANIERIEVLKGPASILYGATSPGGVINLVTKKPLSEPFYSAEVQAGSYDLFRPSIDISGPLTSDRNLLYRLNAVYESGGNFRDFEQEIERVFLAPVISWNIGDRTDLSVELEYLNDERPFDRGIIAFGDGIADIPFDRILGEPNDFVESEEFNASYKLEHRFSENWKLRNAFRYARSESSLFATQGSGELDETTGILPREYAVLDQFDEAYTLQTNIVGKFATGSVEHTLLFGVDLIRDSFEQIASFSIEEPFPAPINIFDPVYEVFPRPDVEDLSVVLDSDLITDRVGIYVQDQIEIGDQWNLLVGGRYDIVDQELKNNPTFFEPTSSVENPEDEAFSPRLGIVYQPSESVSLYTSYSRSFEPNSGTTITGEFLEPERGTQYEVGIKTKLLNDKLLATLAFYHLTKTNIATSDPEDTNFLIAVGEQRSQGIELDLIGEILPGWNIIASYAYTDAEITEDNDLEVGNRLYNTPEHSASLWTTYEIQNGNLQGLGFGIGFFFVGERAGDLENSYEVPSYFLTDAAIYYQRNNWRAGLNFKNIFDVDYIKHAFGRSDVKPGAPFTVIGSVSVEF